MASPVVMSLVPSSGTQGQKLASVQFTGQNTNFDTTSLANVSGGGISVGSVDTVGPLLLVALDVTIDATAAPGTRDVSVTTGTEVATGTGMFVVQLKPTPAFGSIDPNVGAQGDTVEVYITGQNTTFGPTSVLTSSNTGITVSNVSATDATDLSATLTLAPTAPSGPSDVTVTTGAEVVTGTGAFSVIVSTVKSEILMEAVNTYLRQHHVTDQTAVDVCEEFIENVHRAMRGGGLVTVTVTGSSQ